ncbi:amidase family protein [Pseudarthrobacter sp. NPDC092419]|uniref:amidase family protein n=1 Tax=Pseudarthrobacter sp. NPDC092419 TaxID=3364414 RepID=UPI003818580A
MLGTTVNLYNPDVSARGSSGGAAAPLPPHRTPGDGSDMGGSPRIPASFCNISGFRPSLGVIPLALTHNSCPWLARTGMMWRHALAMASVPDRILCALFLVGYKRKIRGTIAE